MPICVVCRQPFDGGRSEIHCSTCRMVVSMPQKLFPSPTIQYTMTPERFVLEIPVEALAGLSQDAHTRMLDMLNAWILRHKPPKVETPK